MPTADTTTGRGAETNTDIEKEPLAEALKAAKQLVRCLEEMSLTPEHVDADTIEQALDEIQEAQDTVEQARFPKVREQIFGGLQDVQGAIDRSHIVHLLRQEERSIQVRAGSSSISVMDVPHEVDATDSGDWELGTINVRPVSSDTIQISTAHNQQADNPINTNDWGIIADICVDQLKLMGFQVAES